MFICIYVVPVFFIYINIFHYILTVLGSEKGRCVASEYFTEPEIEITTENTANILSEWTWLQNQSNILSTFTRTVLTHVFTVLAEMVRTATPFPMVSLLFVFMAFIISNVGHIRPQRTILAFVSGIFFILSGSGKPFLLQGGNTWCNVLWPFMSYISNFLFLRHFIFIYNILYNTFRIDVVPSIIMSSQMCLEEHSFELSHFLKYSYR